MQKHWGIAQEMEEMQYQNMKDTYSFNKENPYKDIQNPHVEFIEAVKTGDSQKAIYMLEEHLKHNETDSEGWRMLGFMLQENDQDQQSCTALLQSIKHNPSDLHSLLQLGVSCTNILDEVHAMKYLWTWLSKNPSFYQHAGNNPILEEKLLADDWKIEEIKGITDDLIQKFEQAKTTNPKDIDLLTSLGVLYFIKREYQAAVEHFQETLNIDPNNYLLWNKFGAAIAHLGQNDVAQQAYFKALDNKPNYVRAWVNLAMAHGSNRDYQNSVNFYLNALALNPEANHIWSYLESSFICSEDIDKIPMLRNKDVTVFSGMYDIINAKELPVPENSSYVSMTEKYHLKDKAENWVNKFNKDNSDDINKGSPDDYMQGEYIAEN